MVGSRLLPYSKKAEGPLKIFQGNLELDIQLVTYTQFAYTKHALSFPGGLTVLMAELGYGERLCKMAVVNAAAAWDGFIGNIIRAVRENGKKFKEDDVYTRLSQMKDYQEIMEPLARRHCIVHNQGIIDSEYKKSVPNSNGRLGDELHTDLDYLKSASGRFFNAALNLMKYVVRDGYLEEKFKEPISPWDGNPKIY